MPTTRSVARPFDPARDEPPEPEQGDPQPEESPASEPEPQDTSPTLDYERVDEIPLDLIQPNPKNQRKSLGDLTELAASIKAVGVLSPIVVNEPRTGQDPLTPVFEIVFGHRRHAAARLAGLATIPAIVRKMGEHEQLEAMLIENLQRSDLEPTEEAAGFQQLLALGHTQRQLADRLGRSHSHISKRLALLGLPEVAIKALEKRALTVEDAVLLTKLREYPDQIAAIVKRERGDVEWAVKQALDNIESARKRAEARSGLEAHGVTVVDPPKEAQHYHHWTPPGARILGKSYGQLPITVAKHRKEACHAAVIQWDGGVLEVCTKPSRHPESKPPEEKSEERRKARERAEKKIKLTAQAQRWEFIKTMLRKPDKAWGVWLAREIVEAARFDICWIAWQLLGNEVEKKSSYTDKYHASLRKLAETDQGALRAAMAVQLAEVELAERGSFRGLASAEGVRENELLVAAGYTVSGYEAKAYEKGLKDAKREALYARREEKEERELGDEKEMLAAGLDPETGDEIEPEDETTCRVCGATLEEIDAEGGTWAEPDLCDSCAEEQAASAEGEPVMAGGPVS